MARTGLDDIIYVLMAFVAIAVETIFFLFCLGGLGSYLMGDIGIFLGVLVGFIVSFLIGRSIYRSVVKDIDKSDIIKEDKERVERLVEYEHQKKVQRKAEAIALARKYPEATKYYFRYHWGITKSIILNDDITDDKVDTLLEHKYHYEQEEQKQITSNRLRIEAEREAKRKFEREAAEQRRREEERERQKREAEIRNLPSTLSNCVLSWGIHSGCTIKHKHFFEYYSYNYHKDDATSSMWNTWKLVWNFKNDPSKNISSYEHTTALNKVIDLVEGELRRTFGPKTEHLTLVCLTASTQRKTELRFKDFAEKVCRDLNMTNAYPYIKVVGEGGAMHEGGSGATSKSYNPSFFNGKYVVLFDDVRTTGKSLERERRILENYGAKVICAITIAQTVSRY